ncbi:MAG: AMP-binding protein [Acidimicrobiales bacterium]|nr:AMP-binding protein [Acidimicrobiales bacterium]
MTAEDDRFPSTAAELVEHRRGDTGGGLVFEGRRWSWDEATGAMTEYAEWLDGYTTGRIPHVGVLLDNVPEFVFLLGAGFVGGSVIVGLNATRRGAELVADVAHTDCAVVVTDAEHRPLLEGLDLGGVPVVDLAERPPGPAVAATSSRLHVPAPEDLALLLFTAGSTGMPKAVRVSQGRVALSGRGLGFGADDVFYCAMPLFHGNALFSSVFPAMGVGATVVLRRRFSASAAMPEVRATGTTFFATIGRALSFILSTPPDPADRDHRLKVVLAPESSVPDMEAFEHRFGVPVIAGYGSSENAVVFLPKPGLPREALGVPLRGLDVAVVDATSGEECERARFDEHGRMLNPDRAIGEIVGRNALDRFEGYYKNPEAETARSRDGWYWTGDLGYRDEDGVFYFAGRTLDWLRVDGENFAAAPLERLFRRYGAATEVAVVGVPDERTVDDQVLAVVETADPTAFDPEDFDAFLGGQADLGTKWSPRYVRVVSSLPVGPTNKVDKQVLRAAGWRVTDPVFWRPARGKPLQRLTSADAEGLERSFAEHRSGTTARDR